MSRDPLLRVLKEAPELASLCTQNGWIDNDTLTYQIIEQEADRWLLAVQFEEIIMEGAGCIAGRIPCYGRVRITQHRDETFQRLEIV
jgi:hypothetical protein